ncbi:hypothetical protein C380_08815 [Acidovorax sp. KKS102]|uniref:hypothetical protein n=1 Tax=Acidovorax sp. KKS102 TaxID=358220 RepID=UPI00028AC510|nr:hypothetical protein [Acidovorax sp. KKS102]AFU45465.1 hypothetical protein C380_08815 [Acidovorax sp. KKS102]
MPAPAQATYSVAALVPVHTTFRDLIDSGALAGSIKIRSAADVLLAQIPLTKPCGTVNGATGQLTIMASGRDDSADASGTAAYGEFCDSDGTVYLSLPTQAGSSAVTGKLVMNVLAVVAGTPVEVVSATIG